ncbi:MAG: 50S ribosomal protein L23 [Calditrichaeota bacterium]|nr:50S ribosomal protein L23 [Calditrichota bacterium]
MKEKQILFQPVFTEKMARLQDEQNKYAFKVNLKANKIEIKKAVEKKFNVKVKSVRTMVVYGKKRHQFTKAGRFEGRRPTWKKAIVTLEEGNQIDLFTNA